MSLIAIAWRAHPDFPLVLIANRDERHDRPTAPAAWWPEAPHCLAGRDTARGGTWLGVSRDGRFALVTGFRDGAAVDAELPSRGQLPPDYLASGEDPVVHARRFARTRGAYPPFNLIMGSPRQVYYAATHSRLPLALTLGVHTLSDGLLDQPWPKCEQLDTLFGNYIVTVGGFSMLLAAHQKLPATTSIPLPGGAPTPADIASAGFAMLADRTTHSTGLPDTGVGQAEEQRLSANFVIGSEHGTRSSTVLVMARDGQVYFEERSFDPTGEQTGRVVEAWQMDPASFSGGD